MAPTSRLNVKATAAVAAYLLVTTWALPAHAQEKARLSGHWIFNPQLSDDAKQKVRAAQPNGRHNADSPGSSYPGAPGGNPATDGVPPVGGVDEPVPGGGGVAGGLGYPRGVGGGEIGSPIGGAGGGVNYPGGNSGDPGTKGGQGGRHEGNRGGSAGSPGWAWLTRSPKFLQIDQQSKQILIQDDSGYSRTFFPDGKKHEDKDFHGMKASSKARWEGNTLVVETKLGQSGTLLESLRLGDGGRQLYLKTRLEAPSLKTPVSIWRVYDRGNAPAH